jgi:hypothetical protein
VGEESIDGEKEGGETKRDLEEDWEVLLATTEARGSFRYT